MLTRSVGERDAVAPTAHGLMAVVAMDAGSADWQGRRLQPEVVLDVAYKHI